MKQPPEQYDNIHDCLRIRRLDELLSVDAIDAALEAGLMTEHVDPNCRVCAQQARRVLSEQTRLLRNWAARERYRARTARLRRRAAERQARRISAAAALSNKTTATPPLPPAVSAALARAKARAAERSRS